MNPKEVMERIEQGYINALTEVLKAIMRHEENQTK